MSSFFNKYYDKLMKPLEQRFFHSIRKRLLEEAKGTVLEIGSGTGINFPYYKRSVHVVAVEPDRSMREQSLARVNISEAPIEVLDAGAERLPFRADMFDTVVCTLVLCTIPDPRKALEEMRRVCKPGGALLLFEHVKLEHKGWGLLQDLLTPVWKKACGGCRLNRNSLELVRQAGFRETFVDWKFKKLFVVAKAQNKK